MLELKSVNKYFNKGKKNEIHVIKDTSLSLPDSGLVALLGESGCGKTTLLNVIGGLDNVKSGSIVINGQKLTGRATSSVDRIRNLSVGYIFQDYKLLEEKTVLDNVTLALKMIGVRDRQERKKRAEYVLDKVGILRYRRRPVSTLSGGEKQRVGIARALVKNPDIILADEPTGNLDSKNSVAIMNLIKKISESRLVLLVTHERKLAEFYADRIIELVDGGVVSDRENERGNELDYELDNIFYLKEFAEHERYGTDGNEINLYRNGEKGLKLNLIVRNGNIYIESLGAETAEVIDENSFAETVDDFYRAVDRESVENTDFNLTESEGTRRKRYSSIYAPFSEIIEGFRRIFAFSALKKLLFAGFALAGIFVMVAVGRIGTVFNVEPKDFVRDNSAYLRLEKPSMSVEEFESLSRLSHVKYILPTDAQLNLVPVFGDYYQTMKASCSLPASLSSLKLLKPSQLLYGRLPKKQGELVLDKMYADKILEDQTAHMCGLLSYKDLKDRTFRLSGGFECKAVGICDTGSPSVYARDEELFTLLYYNNDTGSGFNADSTESFPAAEMPDYTDGNMLTDYSLYSGRFSLSKGSRLPENDYEMIVDESQKELYALNKETEIKVNGHRLKTVGYYSSPEALKLIFCNANTIKYGQILKAKSFMLAADDKDALIAQLREKGYGAEDCYKKSREKFDDERSKSVRNSVAFSAVISLISLIEMFFICRSSFLSRIKEVGTLRAIGAKKTDIYRMFTGEIFAIITTVSLPSMLLTYFYLKELTESSILFKNLAYMTPQGLLAAIAAVYFFNLLAGLLPAFTTMRKRPAQILSRHDVD